jgi:hypothetical protein
MKLEDHRQIPFRPAVRRQLHPVSKTLTDYEGGQSQRDAYRDNANRRLDKTYAGIDATHVINANFIWDLPVGTGKPLAEFASAGC